MSDEITIEGLGELKNALEVLVNVLYLIREDCGASDEVLRWVEIANGQTVRMARTLTPNDSGVITPICGHCKNRLEKRVA